MEGISDMTRELTGRHVLAITLAAFGVIIGVNVLMAVLAVGSFPGLEVPNSYVASQHFDREQRAQAALGWSAEANYDEGALTIAISDAQGHRPALRSFTATVGRPTHKRSDVTPHFVSAPAGQRATLRLEPGRWIIQVHAVAPDGTPFRQRLVQDVAEEGAR